MPPIDQATLYEQVFHLLTQAAETAATNPAQAAGQLSAPMAELNAPPRSFAEIYGPEGRLLPHLAAKAAAAGDAGLARLLETLEQRLGDGSLELAGPKATARRLLAYVYPVI